ncbi:MAG: Mu-like prophage major head subunit gpT family protein [Planctomycetota bacterium]|jgi:hypothetical protein
MATPHVSTNFPDTLDPRFEHIFWEEYYELPDMIPRMYSMPPTNGRNDMRWSQTGTVPDFTQFTGTVDYGSFNQGYDTTLTPVEFTRGVQAERKLVDDDQYNILDARPKGLAASAFRTRQLHGAQRFNNAFSTSNPFYVNSEAVSLCNNSHTTTSGASTANGFDNLGTAALAATAVAAARIAMTDFRGDQAERLSVIPDELVFPPNLYEEAYEIINASGKVDTDLNNPNVHQGQYTGIEWNYLTDTNNWFMCDSRMRKMMLHWTDRTGLEFASIEDFDTLIRKYRAYMRYGNAHTDWRFVYGHQVS